MSRVRAALLAAVAALASSALSARPARAQVPAAGTDTTPLLLVAAARGREVAMRLEPRATAAARTPAARAAATQYALGLDQLARSQFDSAVTSLTAAATASPDNARYRADLGFAFAASGKWSDAEDQYRIAVRQQSRDPWYYVSLGAVQLAQQHWAQASASFTLAVAADSVVIIRQMVEPVGNAYEKSNATEQLGAWARMATTRFPDEVSPWLWLATVSMGRDSAIGLPAIRHYVAARPQDPVGTMLLAEYLYQAGHLDSAAMLASHPGTDSSLKRLAARILYNVGGHYLSQGQADSAATVLAAGRPMADSTDLAPHYDILIGVARLRLFQTFYNDAARHSDCHKAHPADSMLTDVVHLLTAGAAADSALSSRGLQVTSQYRPAVDQFVRNCDKGH